jgi:hypothetical protein
MSKLPPEKDRLLMTLCYPRYFESHMFFASRESFFGRLFWLPTIRELTTIESIKVSGPQSKPRSSTQEKVTVVFPC